MFFSWSQKQEEKARRSRRRSDIFRPRSCPLAVTRRRGESTKIEKEEKRLGRRRTTEKATVAAPSDVDRAASSTWAAELLVLFTVHIAAALHCVAMRCHVVALIYLIYIYKKKLDPQENVF